MTGSGYENSPTAAAATADMDVDLGDVRKLIVIGGGAAAYSAAIYAARANLEPLVTEGSMFGWGGLLARAATIGNYPGFPDTVQGPELLGALREQARRNGSEFVGGDVTRVELDGVEGLKEVWVGEERYLAEELIIATGASPRTLGIDSEARLIGRGIAFCTTCQPHHHHTVVVGGGDAACADALSLALYIQGVTLIHRSETFTASAVMVDRVRANPNIRILSSTVVREITGSHWVDGVEVENMISGEHYRIDCDGVFVALGFVPNSELFAGQLVRNGNGFLVTRIGSTETIGPEGVYAAGAVTEMTYHQIVTSAAAGCQAAMDATRSFANRGPGEPAGGRHTSLRLTRRKRAALTESRRGRIVVLIPAHNEEKLIGAALASLAAQTRVADEVIVVADRCTDGTWTVANSLGATVRVTLDNDEKKAGALNQMLSHLLPRLDPQDAVLVMDADSTISADFLEVAEQKLREPHGRRRPVGGVGGIFHGDPVSGLIERLQENEYLRYTEEIGRRQGRADVLTGTATLFSVQALRDVCDARRSGHVPGGRDIYVYDVKAQTEDNELTLALKHLGYRCVSPRQCAVGTEVMPSVSRLYLQRLRWQRGAIENISTYGVTRHTLPYIFKQVLTYLGIAFVPFFWTVLAYTWLSNGQMPWSWFWVGVGGLIALERVWAVRKGGWKPLLIAATLLPEIIYDQFLHVVYVKSGTDIVTNARERWDHTTPAGLAAGSAFRRLRGHVLSALVAGAPLTITIAAAIGCTILGVAWPVISIFVLVGAGQAVLRLSGLDPFGRMLGSGELSVPSRNFVPSD